MFWCSLFVHSFALQVKLPPLYELRSIFVCDMNKRRLGQHQNFLVLKDGCDILMFSTLFKEYLSPLLQIVVRLIIVVYLFFLSLIGKIQICGSCAVN